MNRDMPHNDCSNLDDRIDECCDAFELAWRCGTRPRITDFLGLEDQPFRKKLFCELLLVELEFRQSIGEEISEEFYLREFPEFASQVNDTKFRYGAKVFSTAADNRESTVQLEPKKRGDRIGHFELIECLGAGAMGEAWKAWDARLRRNVTIKLPHCQSLAENDLRRFLREGEAAAQLSHSQLAGVYEVGNDAGAFYIVTTFVDGENLQKHASKRQLQFKEIVELCASMGDALQCAHDEGVVHRDLKPANIIVDSNRLPHIIDFGLAKIQDADRDLTMNGELLGTPAYMPPELANGDGANADTRTDVYALGVILYELLTGRCPFEGNRGAIISQILACTPAPPRALRPAIPRDLETICLKAIEKNPEKRYAAARDMAEDLRRFALGLPIRARRIGIPERCWGWIRRHPAMTASAMLVAAAIFAASTTISSLQNKNKRLAGYRPVYVTTTPRGARVALVPLDPSTNEPDPARVVRPSETTPLTTELKAGTYLVEAMLPGDDGRNFVEVYRTVSDSSMVDASLARTNKKLGLEPDACRFSDIRIATQDKPIENIVLISIPDGVLQQNPLLPAKLYVDAKQTTPAELKSQAKFEGLLSVTDAGAPCITYVSAVKWAELNQTRLPSSAEYDAIVDSVKHGEARFVKTGATATMEDLFDDFPELSTTTKADPRIGGNAAIRYLREKHIVKGFTKVQEFTELYPWMDGVMLADPDIKSPKMSIRGVRSATPRFLKL